MKVNLKIKDLINKPEEEDLLKNDDGNDNGPQDLKDELHLNHFCCGICKNIAIMPI